MAFSELQLNHVIRTVQGYDVFVPPPLPPRLERHEFTDSLAAAAAALGELKGASRRLENPYMLITPLIRREALTSSAMEGTITTIENMMLSQALPDHMQDENSREANNYVAALRHAEELLRSGKPLARHVIQEAHTKLFSGLSYGRGAGKRPGEYRAVQVAIGSYGDDMHSAKYVPPPPFEATECMSALEHYINRADNFQTAEALIDIAIAHYQFEAIHPFNDGNGRIGRMLVTLMAQSAKLTNLPLLHISAKIEKRKTEYIDLLYGVSTQANWSAWINFFLEITEQSCHSAIAAVDSVLSLQADLRKRAVKNKNNHRLNALIDALFVENFLTVPKAQAVTQSHFQTTQKDLQELVSLGILREINATRPMRYYAPEINILADRQH